MSDIKTINPEVSVPADAQPVPRDVQPVPWPDKITTVEPYRPSEKPLLVWPPNKLVTP